MNAIVLIVAALSLPFGGRSCRSCSTPEVEPTQAVAQAAAVDAKPPTEEPDKWFLSVISAPFCPPCRKLEHDLRTSPSLKEFVNIHRPAESWAFYNEFNINNRAHAQQWEWAGVTQTPTIILQPPKSGRLGDPIKDAVKIVGYTNAKDLADKLNAAVTAATETAKAQAGGDAAKVDRRPFRPRPDVRPQPEPRDDRHYHPHEGPRRPILRKIALAFWGPVSGVLTLMTLGPKLVVAFEFACVALVAIIAYRKLFPAPIAAK